MVKHTRSTRGATAIYRARFSKPTPRLLTARQLELLDTAHFMQERGVSLHKIEAWLREQAMEVA